jgi:hypothetical protein
LAVLADSGDDSALFIFVVGLNIVRVNFQAQF